MRAAAHELPDFRLQIAMRLYLVGFMGAGKTTVGRLLAAKLEIPFFDLDELIESSEETTIKEIFSAKGEPYFRKREREILYSTRYLESAVIATGGGTFTFDENVQFIRAEGFSVYLAAGFDLLRSRIGEKSAERPMFRDDLATHELYQNRLKYYRTADLTVELTREQTPLEITERVLMQIPRNLRGAGKLRTGK